MFFQHLYASPLVSRDETGSLFPVDIIDVRKETQCILQCLKEADRKITWRSGVAEVHSLRKALSYNARVLHFSGHGLPGKIMLENGKCEAMTLTPVELKSLLIAGNDKASSSLKLVFVSACHSESVAEAFVDAGVDHVIVVAQDNEVLDQKALEFAKAFYPALLSGRPVEESFDIAQTQANILWGDKDGDSKFCILGKGDHSNCIFKGLDMGTVLDETPPLPQNDCFAVAEFFVGRSKEVYQVYELLVEGARMVSIVGVVGIGKTQVALQCSRVATERYLFQRVFFLHLTRNDTDDQLIISKFLECFGGRASGDDDGSMVAAKAKKSCGEGNYLLVVDGCEETSTTSGKLLKRIINDLIQRVPTLSIITTSCSPIGCIDGVSERVVSVGPLAKVDAARLLTVSAPRKLQLNEMGGAFTLNSLGENQVFDLLEGHPRAIRDLAQRLSTLNLVEDHKEIIFSIVPSIASRYGLNDNSRIKHTVENQTNKSDIPVSLRLNDTNSDGCLVWKNSVLQAQEEGTLELSLGIPFNYLRQPLSRYFSTVLQGDAVQRPLSSRSLDFFARSRQIWGKGNFISDPGKGIVSPNMFSSFWAWFHALLPCIRSTGIWGCKSPRKIHGFLSKEAAISLLKKSPVGTFVIRFSESRLKCIVIAYVRKASTHSEESNDVQFVQVQYNEALGFQLSVDGKMKTYPTLQLLVQSIQSLNYLYPDILKLDAFSS